jgi:hypothetical protein
LINYQPYTQQQVISILVSFYEKRLKKLELNILPKILKKLFYNLYRKLYLTVDHYFESNDNDDNENMEEEKLNKFDNYLNVDNNNRDENNNKYDFFLNTDIVNIISEDTITSVVNIIIKTILTNSRTVFMNIINDSYYYLYESSSMINKNHPLLLYDAITSIWIALYGTKPESYVMKMIIKVIQHYHYLYCHRHHQNENYIQQSRQQPQQHTDNCNVNEHLGDNNFIYDDTNDNDNNDYTITTNTIDNHKNHKTNNTSRTMTAIISKDNFINTYTTIIKPTISELKSAIKLILQLPNYSCNEDEINDFSIKKKIILKLSPVYMLTNDNYYSGCNHDDNSILKKRRNDFDELDCETCKYE